MGLLSVVIITFNEESNIGRCIESVRGLADEIIVLDSFSTDNTVKIAREMGAIVHQQSFAGYVAQKNKALEFASNDYVLSLDADEALDEVLRDAIAKEKPDFSARAYKMNRCANYCGKFIRHGSWYPEPKLRLFDKRIARWDGVDPHDTITVDPGIRVIHLKGDILHYICKTIGEHIKRNDNFSTIAARSLYERGKRTNWVKALASPAWFFINDYVLRAGFLSGYYGWVIAINQSRYHFQKYAKLIKLQSSD
jgi:glycosyltransferase involved in cell wall biosynthesis